ncbi:hypothetical protein [Corallococcus sp. 4LFB]|uniref:hypothetical protein n=1 Tax=Corallococcus sp. 4LFB TaxID=3383249 RepID=UPI003975E502
MVKRPYASVSWPDWEALRLCAVLEHVRRLVAFPRTSSVFPTPWPGPGFRQVSSPPHFY